jgi:type I restriction enzyme S subunit
MGNKWKTTSLKELGIQLIDCDHKTPKAVEDGIPYIGIPQMDNGRINFDANPRLISEEDFVTWTRKADPKYGDIILSRRCNSGETVYVPKNSKFALGQNLVLLRPEGDRIHPEYLRWAVHGSEWWNEVAKYLNPGAIFESLKCADIPKFKIPEPPKSAQIKIAEILTAISDKIELNQQTNQTLEQMAQALFKSWFVDFDPVFDNALSAGSNVSDFPEALQYRAEQRKKAQQLSDFKPLPDDIRALFSSEFEQTNELSIGINGWIPKGWKESNTDEEFGIKGGSTPSTTNSDFWEGGQIHWTSPKDLSGNDTKILLDTSRKITEAGLVKITSGLLPVDTVLMSSRAPVGYLALAKVPMAINQGYIALRCEQTLSPEYTIQFLDSIMDKIKGISGGTTFAEISKKTFRGIKLVVPIKLIVDAYTSIVKAHYEKITDNIKQTNKLTETRDYLLPKLISGEVELKEASHG